MAINSKDVIRNKNPTKSTCSINVSDGSNVSSQFMRFITGRSKCRKPVKTNSPYLTSDKRQMSTVKGKRLVHKQNPDLISSFPLTACIYKSNSDDVRLTKRTNKTAKSVLTLPNEPLVKPQACTVSDINESEYCNRDDEDRKYKVRKRLPSQNKRRPRITNKNEFEFYDRDARYCSQMNVHLDYSSSDLISDFNGDGKQYPNKSHFADISRTEKKVDNHDVWAVLRNINQFQFRPSPPMSRGNIASQKKRQLNKKRKHLKDTRVIETCRTEEFAYVSDFEVTTKSPNFSQSTSFDRITVINKDHKIDEIHKKSIKDTSNAKAHSRIKNISSKNKRKVNNIYKVKEKRVDSDSNQLMSFKQMESNSMNIKQHIDSAKKLHTVQDEESLYHKTGSSFNTSVKMYNFDQLSLTIRAGDQIIEKNKINMTNSREDGNEPCTRYLGSSKAGLRNCITKNINNKKKNKLPTDPYHECTQEIKGITQIFFNKPPDVTVPHSDVGRIPRVVTTVPSSAITPKISESEKKSPNIKFPIVILGKDQLSSSSIQVESIDAFKFYRLDEQVWPFMVHWYDNKVLSNGVHNSTIENKHESRCNTIISKYIAKEDETKDRKSYNNHNIINKTKMELQRITPCIENSKRQPLAKKIKPMRQFKDKVMQLLYKKSPVGNITNAADDMHRAYEKCDIKKQKHINVLNHLQTMTNTEKKDASTETYNEHQNTLKELMSSSSPSMQFRKTKMARYPWSKVKWASDFIDNIINKVKGGFYYIGENRSVDNKHYPALREASTQTHLSMRIKSFDDYIIGENELIPKAMTNNKKDPLKIIPGFDDALQAIEIKTMNFKKITIKHCLTNVMVEFDVAIPIEPKCIVLKPQKVSSLASITITNSQTKILKCKSTILNSVLPAELCCLLPKMMQSIMEFSLTKHLALPNILSEKNDVHLSTIEELTHCEHSENFKFSLVSHIAITKSRNLMELSKGMITDVVKNKSMYKKRAIEKFSLCNNMDIFTKVEVVLFLPLYRVNPDTTTILSEQKYNVLPKQKCHSCTALQPYVASKRSLIPTVAARSYSNILKKMCGNDLIIHLMACPVYADNIQVTIYNKLYDTENNGNQQLISLSVNKLKINSLYNDFIKPNHMAITNFASNPIKSRRIECVKIFKTEKSYLQSLSSNNIKNKKKCFVRLYKKCKSTSNISGERTSTSLSKIVTIEDFCQVLGSGKLLSSVFEGYTERKILTSLAEMKNWITEINQRQAVLVLLLMNKKDTPNLVRFRSILLQGIAVNRITRASELDMEVEVIETENVNRRSQHEGISHIIPYEQAKDSLLEELYWIAKTTASDYQKPFDESSERQLKTLLEKRKKLNPSYLRVMARYVGLGLLKLPRKNI